MKKMRKGGEGYGGYSVLSLPHFGLLARACAKWDIRGGEEGGGHKVDKCGFDYIKTTKKKNSGIHLIYHDYLRRF